MSRLGVVVTGASSGIGAAIAEKFAKENYQVLLLGRDQKRLEIVQKKCPNSITYAFDLKNFNEHKKNLSEKIASLSSVNILVNNAGIFSGSSFEETADEVWIEQFNVNLLASVQMTKLVWPIFKKQNKGSILNISSTLGVKPAPMTSAYSAIKAAMVNWTLSLAQEGGDFGIRANCVCPGIIDTPIHSFHNLPQDQKEKSLNNMAQFQLLKKIGQSQHVAESAYFLASDLSNWTTGAILNVDGGINIK